MNQLQRDIPYVSLKLVLRSPTLGRLKSAVRKLDKGTVRILSLLMSRIDELFITLIKQINKPWTPDEQLIKQINMDGAIWTGLRNRVTKNPLDFEDIR
jgi:hypothetical protein